MDRRAFLRSAGYFSLLTFTPAPLLASLAEQNCASGNCAFLSPPQLQTLGALCAYFIPGPPDDPDPGALEAGVPQYIDLLLGAFNIQPARIHAGGPFSLRGQKGLHNHFKDFLPLDALEELSWRTRLEGSRGIMEREWNGPVKGWQQTYTEGLQWLEEKNFISLSPFRKGVLIHTARGEQKAFIDLVFEHTVQGMYGAPEYGGNRDLAGWRYTNWPGDHQPMMYTDEQVSQPDMDQRDAVRKAASNAKAYLS